MIAAEPNDLGEKTAPLAPPEPTRPLLPTWIAYPAAGLSFVSAAYLWTSIPTFLALYADLGVAVPVLVELQLSSPRLLPLGLVAAGIVVLLGTRYATTAKRGRSARSLAGTAAVFLALFSILMVFVNTITIRSLQHDGSSLEQLNRAEVEKKLAWAKGLTKPRAATQTALAKVNVAGKGEPLAQVFSNLAKAGKVRIRLAFAQQSVACNTPLSDVEWRTALSALARTHELQIYRAAPDDLILVRSNPGGLIVTDDIRDEPVQSVLKRLAPNVGLDPQVEARVSFRFAYAPGREVIDVLAVLAGCRVVGNGADLKLISTPK